MYTHAMHEHVIMCERAYTYNFVFHRPLSIIGYRPLSMVVGTDPFPTFYASMHASVWFKAWGFFFLSFQTPDQDLNSLGANCYIYLYLYNRFHLLLHNSGNEIVFLFEKSRKKPCSTQERDVFAIVHFVSPVCTINVFQYCFKE